MFLLNRKNLISLFLVGMICTGFWLGFYFGEIQGISKGMTRVSPVGGMDFSLFWEAYHVLDEKFVEPEKLDPEKMIYGAISGMVKSLEDPYTVFMPPKDTKTFMEDVSGVFEGVGMQIDIKKGQLQVIAPLEGTPAQKAGLRAGDKILKVDDTYTQDITIDEAVNLIRGPKGTEVVLTIFREDWNQSKEIPIIRNSIEIPSLRWELNEEDSSIAYLKLYHFSEKASVDFRKAALEILDNPTQKIILDLRNNPGGYLEVAQDIAGWFLEKGQIVVIEDFGENKEKKEYKSKGNGMFKDYSIIVLMNQGSASGSEILAGALRDNLGVKIIGETSFGKGSVQELKSLKNGASLKVTVAKWLTPNGELITDKGLKPDIEVEMSEEDYEEERDPQLNKAIEILKEMR
jgi:carboxyl-terminal processing protease